MESSQDKNKYFYKEIYFYSLNSSINRMSCRKYFFEILKLFNLLICTFSVLTAQNVNIPDVNFKSYLLSEKAININGDSEIQTTEAAAFVGHINVSNLSISDLTGIEAFTSLKVLNCFNNQLTTIDLSGNTSLQSLYCNNNQITSLDLSANINLFQLQCNHNQLTTLNLSANTALKYVYCQENSLNTLNVIGLSKLAILYCANNNLSTINISDNDSLVELDISYNNITSLNLVECKKLQVINVKENELTTFNTMANSKLNRLDCSDNNLTELSIASGWNHKIKKFDSKGNVGLTCIEVDNVTWANTNLSSGKDTFVNFSVNCP
jgi:Leucine-rich repeat (LRR) protein